ncbi:hypothetical protein ABPG72_021637 [Tetrahymena utriculariae]
MMIFNQQKKLLLLVIKWNKSKVNQYLLVNQLNQLIQSLCQPFLKILLKINFQHFTTSEKQILEKRLKNLNYHQIEQNAKKIIQGKNIQIPANAINKFTRIGEKLYHIFSVDDQCTTQKIIQFFDDEDKIYVNGQQISLQVLQMKNQQIS